MRLRFSVPLPDLDLGLEPPIPIRGAAADAPQKRKVNLRWLLGTVLTGITGTALMLLAAASSIDPRRSAVSLPQLVSGRDPALAERTIVTMRRADKLVRKVDLIAARHTFRVPVLVRSGSAEVIRQASFTKVSSTLALESLGFASAVPPFNLSRLVAVASEDRAAETAAAEAEPDAEVSLVARDMTDREVAPAEVNLLSDETVLPQIIDTLSQSRRNAPSTPIQLLLANALATPREAGAAQGFAEAEDPFSKLVVRMVPENISVLPRIEQPPGELRVQEQVLTIRSDESAAQILRRLGASPDEARGILAALTRSGGERLLEANRRLKVTTQAWEPGRPPGIVKVELYGEEIRLAAAGRRDDGSFAPIETTRPPPAGGARPRPHDDDEDEEAGGLTLFASLHETLRKHAVPPALIDEIIKVVFFDVDLQRRVTPGDSIELLIANDEVDPSRSELQLVAISVGGTKRRFYRFQVPREDVVDYFDDQGRSAKQFLIRKPLDDGELRSGFGYRRHPILGYTRMHTGVDWANRVGTPIRAAGNGVVVKADWDSGYGRRIEIEHNNGYMTTYSHLSAFAPGIREGVRVRQGQIIGRLGSTGLSTGPHLHYEVMINGRFQDPLSIRLPRGRELSGPLLAEFKRMRDQVEDVLQKAPGSADPERVAGTAPTR